MSLTLESQVGKKYAVYLPKAIVKALNLKEGEKILLRVVGNTVVLESVQDPIQLALSRKKFASITPEQIEVISLEEQYTKTKSSA